LPPLHWSCALPKQGRALNQGEVCTCLSRALVHESIYDRFMEKAIARVNAIKLGSPLDFDTMIGAQASNDQLEKILSYIAIGKGEGAKVLTGGSRHIQEGELAEGYYVQPTVLEGHNRMRIFQEEIFGPVLSVTTFKGNDEALSIANVTIAPNLRRRENLPAIASQGIDTRVQGEGASLDLDGNRPAQTPEFAASLTLGWQPAPGWQVAGTLRHVSTQFEDDRETDRLAPATTLDAFIAAPLYGPLSLIARAENLTDEPVITRNQGGSIDLGTPRTLWLGMRYGF
jgi:hypothetical protein